MLEAAPTNGAGDVTMAEAEAIEPPTAEAMRAPVVEAVAASRRKRRPVRFSTRRKASRTTSRRSVGVGPVLEQKLHSLGITKLDQIANFSDEEIEKVDTALNFKGRIQRDDWIGQAKTLIGEA